MKLENKKKMKEYSNDKLRCGSEFNKHICAVFCCVSLTQ